MPELAVAGLALVSNLWRLDEQGYGNSYYAAAARSMTTSWSNWLFAGYDPGGWVSLDKPPLAWWVPAAATRLFGYSSWTLLGPSAIVGALGVLLLAITVGRVWGRPAGLIAGLALATTPVEIAVSRSNNPDIWLVTAVVAAGWALERGIATGRLRWPVLMGALVGLGFITKLAAALIVAPGLWLALVLVGALPWRRRLLHGLAGALALVAVVAAWLGSRGLVPASSRPYQGGSTDGTAWQLVTGYDGIGRLTGAKAIEQAPKLPAGLPPGSINPFGGSPGASRLFNLGMADQVMWLAVPALAAVLAGGLLLVRRQLGRQQAGSLLAWTGWGGLAWFSFSFAKGVFHNYYVSLLAPAIAALVGIAAALFLRANQRGRLLAAPTLLATGAMQLVFLRRIDALLALRVLVPAAALIVAALVIAELLAAGGVRPAGSTRRRTALLAAGTAAILLAPSCWSYSSLGHTSSGSFPEARPVALEPDPNSVKPGGPINLLGAGLAAGELDWLRGQRRAERWLVAVPTSFQASSAIIHGYSVLAVGGFEGNDAALTVQQLSSLVGKAKLRFVDVGAGSPAGPPATPPAATAPPATAPPAGAPPAGGSWLALAAAAAVCQPVPAQRWGATGPSTLFDCAGRAGALAGLRPSH